jgi:prepilin-type N-terminal cleavage/methylation domain-containing protein
MTPQRPPNPARRRRGFTLVEMLVAAMLTAMLLGSVSMTLSRLSRAKNTCKSRLEAYMRADLALNLIRRDVASLIRSDDLFDTRFLLNDYVVSTSIGDLDRDELLIFNTRMRPIRNIDFNGEGIEYETQYRVTGEGAGTMLWQRRDAVPDEYSEAGGMATPLVRNLISLNIEAYDGRQWWNSWDSDADGIPHAVRISVIASGARPDEPAYETVHAVLSTAVAIDRARPPADLFQLTEEEIAYYEDRVLIDPSIATPVTNPAGAAGAGGAGSPLGASGPTGPGGGPGGVGTTGPGGPGGQPPSPVPSAIGNTGNPRPPGGGRPRTDGGTQ